MSNEEYDEDGHQVTRKESSVLSPRGEESSVLSPRGEDGHQVTRTGNLWQSGGEAEQSKNEKVEGGITNSVSQAKVKVEEATPPTTPTQKPDDEITIVAVQRQAQPKVAQQHRIRGNTVSGKGKSKPGDNVATRPPEGRSEGKGGKSSHVWTSPSRFALHASKEMFTAISPIKCESLVNTHGNDDYADDDADAYDVQDGNEFEDSHEGYDTSGDVNGERVAANDIEKKIRASRTAAEAM